MTHWFVGQKVVCIDDNISRYWVTSGMLQRGAIYIIRDVYVCPLDGGIGLRVHGVTQLVHPKARIEMGFYEWRFRPVVEKKADIAVFTAILDRANSDQKISEDA